jgi:hypothetical protein
MRMTQRIKPVTGLYTPRLMIKKITELGYHNINLAIDNRIKELLC